MSASDRLKNYFQRKSNEAYERLNPNGRKAVGFLFRGSKRAGKEIDSRAGRGKQDLKRIILGCQNSFSGALINEPGSGRSRPKRIVSGKSAGKLKPKEIT